MQRLPWQMASVKLDCGPLAFVALRGQDNRPGMRVSVVMAEVPGGSQILIAADNKLNLRDADTLAELIDAVGYGVIDEH